MKPVPLIRIFCQILPKLICVGMHQRTPRQAMQVQTARKVFHVISIVRLLLNCCMKQKEGKVHTIYWMQEQLVQACMVHGMYDCESCSCLELKFLNWLEHQLIFIVCNHTNCVQKTLGYPLMLKSLHVQMTTYLLQVQKCKFQ